MGWIAKIDKHLPHIGELIYKLKFKEIEEPRKLMEAEIRRTESNDLIKWQVGETQHPQVVRLRKWASETPEPALTVGNSNTLNPNWTQWKYWKEYPTTRKKVREIGLEAVAKEQAEREAAAARYRAMPEPIAYKNPNEWMVWYHYVKNPGASLDWARNALDARMHEQQRELDWQGKPEPDPMANPYGWKQWFSVHNPTVEWCSSGILEKARIARIERKEQEAQLLKMEPPIVDIYGVPNKAWFSWFYQLNPGATTDQVQAAYTATELEYDKEIDSHIYKAKK